MAKTVMGNVSFQWRTAKAALSPVVVALSLMTLAAALPAVLLVMKQDHHEPVPYLVIDIAGEPERFSPLRPNGRLPTSP